MRSVLHCEGKKSYMQYLSGNLHWILSNFPFKSIMILQSLQCTQARSVDIYSLMYLITCIILVKKARKCGY